MSTETMPQVHFTKAKSGQLNRVAQFSIIDSSPWLRYWCVGSGLADTTAELCSV